MRSARSRRIAFGAGFLVYAALLLISISVLSAEPELPDPLRAAIALIPVPAAIAIILVAIGEFLASDELQQRVQLAGLAFAFLGTLLVSFSWGFLEGIGFERPSGFVVFGMLGAFYGAGLLVARRRYL